MKVTYDELMRERQKRRKKCGRAVANIPKQRIRRKEEKPKYGYAYFEREFA